MVKKKSSQGSPTIFQKLTPSKDYQLPPETKESVRSFYSYKPYSKIPTSSKLALAMLVTLLLAMPIGLGLTIQPKAPLLSKAGRDLASGSQNSTPSITTNSLSNGQIGVRYEANISGLDINIAQELTLEATNLPGGLSLENCKESLRALNTREDKVRRLDCTIEGTPQESGVYQITFSLNDNTETLIKTIPLTITR